MGIEYYQSIIDAYGPPTDAIKVSRAEADLYRGRLPDGLLDFWVEYGRGVWLPQCKYQLCDPQIFESVLRDYFEGDPEFKAEDFVVYGMNGEGSLEMCFKNNIGARISSNFQLFTLMNFKGASENIRDKLDYYLARGLKYSIDADETWSDNDGNNLHNPAVERLGPLAPGEMYGFFPALIAGGDNILENMRKVRAPEYHAMLASLRELRYFDYGLDNPNQFTQPRVIRMIGPQE